MAKENKTVFVILGLLSHEPMTGYELKKRIDLSLSYFWETSYGQIYPTLSQLEEKGHVTKVSDAKGQKLERIVYTITDSGRAVLMQWLEQPIVQQTIKYEVLLKLFFGSCLSPDQNLKMIEHFASGYSQELPKLEQYERSLESVLGDSPDHLQYLLTVKFGKHVFKAYEQWAEEAKYLIEQYHQGRGGSND